MRLLKFNLSKNWNESMSKHYNSEAYWHAVILTLFPEIFPGPLNTSLAGKALKDKIWRLDVLNFRDFVLESAGKVDDEPFGGGAGMVMRPDIVDIALESASKLVDDKAPIIYLTPRGRPLDQTRIKKLASGPGAVLICGRYEGIDQRVIEAREVEEVSLGDFVLSGGEIASLALLDSVIRLLPGVLGNEESLSEESFEQNLLEYPHYTRPAVWHDLRGKKNCIPDILSSGDHGKIKNWRRKKSEEITQDRRPDLWAKHIIK